MEPSPVEALGPPPFRFQPSRGAAMQGPAFSLTFKLLVSVVVLGCGAWLLRLWLQGQLDSSFGPGGASWFFAGQALMLWTWWSVLRSVTGLDPQALTQSWIWPKRMELRELAYGKMIRVRGLEWLIAPRLYVRTLLGKFAVFYTADPAMTEEFERLVVELKAFRGFR